MPSTRSAGAFIRTSTVSGVALSEVLTAANVAAPIITVLRLISMSWYINYDAATEYWIISGRTDAHHTARRHPLNAARPRGRSRSSGHARRRALSGEAAALRRKPRPA